MAETGLKEMRPEFLGKIVPRTRPAAPFPADAPPRRGGDYSELRQFDSIMAERAKNCNPSFSNASDCPLSLAKPRPNVP